jgi:hypothetical protein
VGPFENRHKKEQCFGKLSESAGMLNSLVLRVGNGEPRSQQIPLFALLAYSAVASYARMRFGIPRIMRNNKFSHVNIYI